MYMNHHLSTNLTISMINHGISLSNNINIYLNEEFVNVKCRNSSLEKANQYNYLVHCPASGYDVAGFPLVEIFIGDYDKGRSINFENKDYFIFPISEVNTNPIEATYGVA